MLILSRNTGESLVIDGRVVVKIIRTDGTPSKWASKPLRHPGAPAGGL
jgi:sRNA-binding carbon storage regulator CsrA